MQNLIDQLDRLLAQHRLKYYRLLRPGVAARALDEFEAKFGLKLPFGFRTLYRWRDGQPDDLSENLYDNWMFMSLAAIQECKAEYDSMIGLDFDDPRYWRRGWVPFLHNGGGSRLCVDLAAEDGGKPGQILEFWKADQDRPIKHADIEAWLRDVVANAANPNE